MQAISSLSFEICRGKGKQDTPAARKAELHQTIRRSWGGQEIVSRLRGDVWHVTTTSLQQAEETQSAQARMEEGVTAAALRGAAEEAVALKNEISQGEDYPAPPPEDGSIAVVPSISSDKKDIDHTGRDRRSGSRNTGDCSEESACPPSKRQHTMIST